MSEAKQDPYSPQVQRVVLEEPTPQKQGIRALNRKVALGALLALFGVLTVAILLQTSNAEENRQARLEATRLEEQEVKQPPDPAQAQKEAEQRLEEQLAAIEKEKQRLARENASRELVVPERSPQPSPLLDEASTTPSGLTIAQARAGASVASGEGSAGDRKEAEDPWVMAREQYRQAQAQAFYQERGAALRAPMFFGSGSPSSSKGEGWGERSPDELDLPKPQSEEQAAFAARLREARGRAAQPGRINGGMTTQLTSGDSVASIQDPRQASSPQGQRGSGAQQQEEFYPQGARAQTGYQEAVRGDGRRVDVQAGTVVHLVLETGLSSELPGVVLARVASPVYDPGMSRVTIPSGTRVLGTYNARVEPGQTRVQVVWTSLILSSGHTVELGGLPGVDLGGQSGVEASVDNHWDKAAAGGALSALFSASASALSGPTNSFNVDPRQQAIQGAARPAQEMGEGIAEKFLGLEPTLTLEPGALAGMLVTRDLLLF